MITNIFTTLRWLSFVFIFVCVAFIAEAQQIFKTTPASTIGFLEYLPQDYNNGNSNKYPVVIFLHGLGERGANTTDLATLQAEISKVAMHGPPKHVKNGTQFPFILISPQLKNNYGSWPSSYVMEMINYCKTYLRIDERRIYITGLSLGGGGTWVAAQDYPKLFAAIAPVCGSGNTPSKACLLATESLPVWAFHGDADGTVSLSRSTTMVDAINACTPKPSPLAKMTIYPGVAHNSWDRAYTLDNTYHTPNLYTWLMSFTNTTNAGNKIPIANAGADRNATTSSISLSGSGTDSDGTIASYAWTKTSGPAAVLTGTSASSLSLSGLVNGTYMFRLTVTDNSGNTDSDYVKVSVQLSSVNVAPVANAGADLNIVLPTTTVSLKGSATDSDGVIASYLWSQVSGPATATISNANTATAGVSALSVSGVYEFQLLVKDDKDASAADKVLVTVDAQLPLLLNIAPIADAGKDLIIDLPTSGTVVNGSGRDTDGTIVSYAWKQLAGPKTTTILGGSTSTITVSGLTTAGFYVYQLTVTDDKGATGSDKVGVKVVDKTIVAAGARASGTEVLPEDGGFKQERFSETESEYWINKRVVVYSETGAQIYAGLWSAESYQQVFSVKGFYVYNVLDNGRRVAAGKIVVIP